jgi:diguanylate cyclase (GGDEF)-like protein/PAS domain S-box-containing protein
MTTPRAELAEIRAEADRLRRRVNELEIALAEAHGREHWQQRLADKATVFLYVYDLRERRIIYVNPNTWQPLGYSLHEFQSHDRQLLPRLLHPDDLTQMEARHQRFATASDDDVIETEYRMRAADGSWVWLLSRDRIFERDPDGTPTHIIGTVHNMSQHKHLTEELRTSGARYRAITELVSDYVFLLRVEDGHNIELEWVSEPFLTVTGYTLTEAIDGQTWRYRLIHPDDQQSVAARLARNLAGEQDANEHRIYTRDGDIRWMRVQSRPLWDEEGQHITHIIGAAHDVTAQKQAEEALQESQTRLQAIWETATDAMVLSDAEGVVLTANPAYFELHGYTAEQVVGQPFAILFPEEQRAQVLEEYRQIFHSGATHRHETSIRRADGSTRIVESHVDFLEHDGQRVAMLSVVRDVTRRKHIEEELRQSQRFIAHVTETLPAFIYIYDIQTRQPVYSNRDPGPLLGYPPGHFPDLMAFLQQTMHPDDLAAMPERNQRRAQARDGEILESDYRYCAADGSWRWVVGRETVFERDDDGAPTRIIGTILDVTAQKQAEETLRQSHEDLERRVQQRTADLHAEVDSRQRAEEALRESQHFIEKVAETVPDTIYVYDLIEQRNIYVNREITHMLGYTPEQVQAMGAAFIPTVLHPDDAPIVAAQIECFAYAHDGDILTNEYRMKHADGAWRWLHTQETIFARMPDGLPRQILGVVQDITERKAAELQLYHLAMHDELTGLPNRTRFQQHLADALQTQPCSVLFIDCDKFKVVNDSMGHIMGDLLLVALAERLKLSVPPGALIARFGGDEFLVLLEEDATCGAAVAVAGDIHQALQTPMQLEHFEIVVTASIGIARSEPSDTTPEDLIRNANMAMYQAKSQGRSQTDVYDHAMHQQALGQLQVETGLRRAIQRGEIFLIYQPLIELASGEVIGFEALARWQHPERGLLSAGQFIPAAEVSELIMLLDWALVRQACKQGAAWLHHLPPGAPLTINVNISGRTFLHPGLVEQIAAVLRESDLPAQHLQLEITETVAMDHAESTIETLHALGALGVQVALDDFGMGYSSLRYLQRFPVHSLKIDASFVRTLDQGDGSAEIVQMIISLAHTLGLRVVAEGIETAVQQQQLQAMGCEYGQGFLFARGLDAATAAVLPGRSLP